MIKVGIVGGAGYTGGELLRILLNHPQVSIQFIHSQSNAGNPVYAVHQDLLGETDLYFADKLEKDIDVLFLCVGHGDAGKFLENNTFPENVKLIDLSRDHRIANSEWVYGLPELNKTQIQESTKIANPGCFATCVQLALLPLASAGVLKNEIHVNATTGSTGAGQKPMKTTHFTWRNSNLSIYKAFTHQHLDEIYQSISQLQPTFDKSVNFLPHRGAFSRGIFASAYTETDLTLEETQKLYSEFYKDAPFTILSDFNPNLKQIVNTNKCVLYLEKHENKLLIISMIDNLAKGASGQAVQNMNLMCGLPETTGLRLKNSAF